MPLHVNALGVMVPGKRDQRLVYALTLELNLFTSGKMVSSTIINQK
jgi:hypothetical protein